jgi:hypothetical protein
VTVATAASASASASARHRRATAVSVIDYIYFVLGTIAAGWLAYLIFRESFSRGFVYLWFLVIFWAVLAYLLLPRVHRLLTLIYVPDYFIGRARTNEGLLGDPVNLALFGTEAQLHTAMLNADWSRADEIGFRSSARIVASTVLRRSYSDAPVSPLYLFGNMQSFTYQQEIIGSPAKRHHVRFWKTPDGWLLPGGNAADWLAAGTYDRDVGLSLFTLQVTHKIARETDRERDHITSTIATSDPRAKFTVIRNFSTGYHSVNGGGDAIVTDGDLPIIDLRDVTPTEAGQASASPMEVRALPADATAAVLGKAVIERALDTSSSNRVRRPISIYLSYLLMIIRAGIAIGSGITIVGNGADAVATVVLVVFGLLVYLGLAQLMFWGFSAARFIVMTFSLLAVVGVAFGGEQAELTIATGLLNLIFDILVLFSLSSSDAREFVRERRQRRHMRRSNHTGRSRPGINSES